MDVTGPPPSAAILRVLWERGDCTASDIRQALNEERGKPIAHSTVVTLIQRLEQKGHIKQTGKRIGKAFVYRAALKPQRARKHFLREFLSRHFGDDPIPLFSSLIESGDLSSDEIKELRKMLDRLERSHSGGNRPKGGL